MACEPLSRGVPVSAAARDEGIGAPCFHSTMQFLKAFFFFFFKICVLLVDVHQHTRFIKIHFLSDINNIKDSSILSEAVRELCLYLNVESYLNFKMI